MAREPSFSVVVPAFQAAATIESALASVLAQTVQDFEVLVVDDGCSDGTVERVATLRDERIEVLRHSSNRGLSAARNTGIEHARGRYVSMLDSDDLWLPGYLEEMGRAFAARPDAGFAYTDAWVLDDRTKRFLRTSAMHYQRPPDPPPERSDAFLAELVERNFVFTSTTVPRAVLDEVGPFNVALPSAEDYELWLRITASGYPAVRVPGRLAVYRRRPDSLSRNEALMLRGLAEAFAVVARHPNLSPEIVERAEARRRDALRRLAALEGGSGPGAALERARRRLQDAKQAVALRLLRTSRVPAEVRAAFPDPRAL